MHLPRTPIPRPPLTRIALLTVLALGAWHDAALLLRHPVAVGTDGYYYVLQLDELRSSGRLYFPTSTPLVLYLLAGLSRLTGDTVLAVKAGAVLLHALLGSGVYALVAAVTGSRWLGVVGCALAVTSGLHLYLISEFVNNLGAVVFLLWCGWCAARFAETRHAAWAVCAAGCLAAAALSHRSALFLAPIMALLAHLAGRLTSPESSGRCRVLVAAAVLFAWLAPAALRAQSMFGLPVWVGSELAAAPSLPLNRVTLAENLFLLVGAPVTLILLVSVRRRADLRLAGLGLGAVAMLSLLITVNPFLNLEGGWLGIAGRLSSLSYVQAAILWPGLLFLLSLRWRVAAVYGLAALVPLTVLSFRAPLPPGLRPGFLKARAQLIEGLRAHRGRFPASALIVSPHGDQFIITAFLGIPSQQRPPESAQYQNVYWLLRRVEPNALDSAIMVLTKEAESGYAVIVREADLRRQFGLMSPDEQRRLLTHNPHLYESYQSPNSFLRARDPDGE